MSTISLLFLSIPFFSPLPLPLLGLSSYPSTSPLESASWRHVLLPGYSQLRLMTMQKKVKADVPPPSPTSVSQPSTRSVRSSTKDSRPGAVLLFDSDGEPCSPEHLKTKRKRKASQPAPGAAERAIATAKRDSAFEEISAIEDALRVQVNSKKPSADRTPVPSATHSANKMFTPAFKTSTRLPASKVSFACCRVCL
jgi:hypothetical protein